MSILISRLPAAGSVSPTDQIVVDQSGVTRRALLSLLTAGFTINDQVGASYNPVLADTINTIIRMNNAGVNNVVIPLNATLAVPIGYALIVVQYGAGVTGFTFAGTLRNPGVAATCRAQYSMIGALKMATDEWLVLGDMT